MCDAKTMKRLLLPTAAAVLLAGCGDGVYALPENAPHIEQTTYVNEKDKDDNYIGLMYGGREYVLYGHLYGKLRDDDVQACVGYADDEKKERVCTLAGTDDYIMLRYVGSFKDEPVFYRAEDTLGKDIYTPDYVQCVEYYLWGGGQS